MGDYLRGRAALKWRKPTYVSPCYLDIGESPPTQSQLHSATLERMYSTMHELYFSSPCASEETPEAKETVGFSRLINNYYSFSLLDQKCVLRSQTIGQCLFQSRSLYPLNSKTENSA
jgi:hypothetical protein